MTRLIFGSFFDGRILTLGTVRFKVKREEGRKEEGKRRKEGAHPIHVLLRFRFSGLKLWCNHRD